jgi:hypothetical protein
VCVIPPVGARQNARQNVTSRRGLLGYWATGLTDHVSRRPDLLNLIVSVLGSSTIQSVYGLISFTVAQPFWLPDPVTPLFRDAFHILFLLSP